MPGDWPLHWACKETSGTSEQKTIRQQPSIKAWRATTEQRQWFLETMLFVWLDDTLHGSRARDCKENLPWGMFLNRSKMAQLEINHVSWIQHAMDLDCREHLTYALQPSVACSTKQRATFYSYVYDKYRITDSSSAIPAICVSAVIHLFSFRHSCFQLRLFILL